VRESVNVKGPDMREYQAVIEGGSVVANGTSYVGVTNTVDDVLEGDASVMQWTCEPDDDTDPIELVIDIESYAELVSKARAYDHLVSTCTCQ
jgi:hypothetical protein